MTVYLDTMLGGMDRQLAGFKEECNALAEQHAAWLAETVETNTKRLQYQTCAAPLPEQGSAPRPRQPRGQTARASADDPGQRVGV